MKKLTGSNHKASTIKSLTFLSILLVTFATATVAFSDATEKIGKKQIGHYDRAEHTSKSGLIKNSPTKEIPQGPLSLEGKKLASRIGMENTARGFKEASDKNTPSVKETDQSATQVGDTMIMERSRTNLDFSESLIEGKMKAPSGFYIQARKGQKLTNLIKLRASFRPEMLKARGLMPDQSNQ